jgi:hypothetical protein
MTDSRKESVSMRDHSPDHSHARSNRTIQRSLNSNSLKTQPIKLTKFNSILLRPYNLHKDSSVMEGDLINRPTRMKRRS